MPQHAASGAVILFAGQLQAGMLPTQALPVATVRKPPPPSPLARGFSCQNATGLDARLLHGHSVPDHTMCAALCAVVAGGGRGGCGVWAEGDGAGAARGGRHDVDALRAQGARSCMHMHRCMWNTLLWVFSSPVCACAHMPRRGARLFHVLAPLALSLSVRSERPPPVASAR